MTRVELLDFNSAKPEPSSHLTEKMINSNSIKLIKDAVRLETVIRNYGYELVPDGVERLKMICPFHSDKQPSLKLFIKTQHWQCFGCDKAGDVFQFIMEKEGLSFIQAVKKLAQQTNISADILKLSSSKLKNNRLKLPVENIPLVESGLKWNSFVSGFSDKHVQVLKEWRGYSQEFCYWLQSEGLIGVFNGNIAFPVHGSTGVVVSVHYRPRGADGWFYHPTGVRVTPWILGDLKTARSIWVFEGEWDAAATMDRTGWHRGNDALVRTALIVTRGKSSGKIVGGLCRPDCTIYAFVQNDLPGEQWLKDLAATAKCNVTAVQTPKPHKDINDWTRHGASREDLLVAINSAKLIKPSCPDPLSDSRPKVELPGDNRLLTDFAAEIGKIVAKNEIFRRGRRTFVLNWRRDSLEIMDPERFRTWVENSVICFRRVRRGDEQYLAFNRTMNAGHAAAILSCDKFLECLRPIENFNTVRLPVICSDNTLQLLPDGYDPETKTYTVSELNYPTDTSFEDAKSFLVGLYSEFCFADPGRSLGVAIAALLTPFAKGLMPASSLRPCFIALANDSGAGKTCITRLSIIPTCGHAHATSQSDTNEEIRKTLHATVVEGRPYVFFDNLQGHLGSPSLLAFLTAPTSSERLLGLSQSFAGPNTATVYLTGNGLTVSPELRRRSLFIELFTDTELPEDRQFRVRLDDVGIFALRAMILGSAYALVRHWNAAERPKPNRNRAGIEAWGDTVAAITQFAGFSCPLEIAELKVGGDTESKDLRALVSHLYVQRIFQSLTFAEVVELSQKNGWFEHILGVDIAVSREAKGKLAKLLCQNHLRQFNFKDGAVRFLLEGKGHTRRYLVRRLEKDRE